MEQQRYCLEKTLELLDPAQFDRAAQAVAGAKRVFVYAKNASRSMAELLAFRLRRIGVDVHAIPAGGKQQSLPCADGFSCAGYFGPFGFFDLSLPGITYH